MKKNYFGYLLILMVFVLGTMVSCTKEGPAGPAGKDGTNGADGTNGTNGTDGTTTCIECHDGNMTLTTKQFQWETSAHAAGSALSRSSIPSCAGCHSTQGFFQTDGNNPLTADEWQGVNDPIVINCYACHPIHTTYTAEDAVALNYPDQPNWAVTHDKTVDIDFGKANTCVHCHQSRVRTPVVDMNDLTAMYSGISTHYGPHYSPQANVMGAFGAYELEGSTVYPATNGHLGAENKCISCHMGYTTSNGNGGHNMHIDAPGDLEKSCAQCHSTGAEAPQKYEDYYHEYFATIDHDGDHPTVNTTSYYTLLGDKLTDLGVYTKVIDSVDGYPEAVHYNINSGLELDGYTLAAFFNHRYLYQDHSHGMHNPSYSKALLKNSLEALN